MKYEFHPVALQEYAEAVEFFALQDRHQDFIDTIEKSIFRIIDAPKRWPVIENQIRRYLTPKFSYAILYRVYSDRIVIAAIMSCRRDPGYWQDRLWDFKNQIKLQQMVAKFRRKDDCKQATFHIRRAARSAAAA